MKFRDCLKVPGVGMKMLGFGLKARVWDCRVSPWDGTCGWIV